MVALGDAELKEVFLLFILGYTKKKSDLFFFLNKTGKFASFYAVHQRPKVIDQCLSRELESVFFMIFLLLKNDGFLRL